MSNTYSYSSYQIWFIWATANPQPPPHASANGKTVHSAINITLVLFDTLNRKSFLPSMWELLIYPIIHFKTLLAPKYVWCSPAVLRKKKKKGYFLYGFLEVWLKEINIAYDPTCNLNSHSPSPVKITPFTEREKNQNKIKFHLYHASQQ